MLFCNRPFVVACTLAAAVAILAMGCRSTSSTLSSDLQLKLDRLQLEKQGLARRNLELEDAVEAQGRRIRHLMGLESGESDLLFAAERIELASLTGGADFDGQPGDDGIVVYLRPLDADGHVIKAAGEITIKLVDNNGPGEPRLLGRYVINDAQELRRAWHGKFMTDHYTIKCPWNPAPEGKPQGREVEIKATLLDWRTGKLLTAHKVVEVSIRDPWKNR